MNAPVINEHIVHFKVSIFTLLTICKFDECVAQAIVCLPVFYNLTAEQVLDHGQFVCTYTFLFLRTLKR